MEIQAFERMARELLVVTKPECKRSMWFAHGVFDTLYNVALKEMYSHDPRQDLDLILRNLPIDFSLVRIPPKDFVGDKEIEYWPENLTKGLISFQKWTENVEKLEDHYEQLVTAYLGVATTAYRFMKDNLNYNVSLSPFPKQREFSTQLMSELCVRNPSLPHEEKYSWHMTNTSQLVFNMGIVFHTDTNRISCHT